ncbi:MAG: four helix bundle protein [Treponemataceae bacterium]|nr:four helix bundle protein [Treponemataceae bacterium]
MVLVGKGAIHIKSKNFAVRIIRLVQFLQKEKKEHVLSKQLLKSGTSIGANVSESVYAQSKADFISKMSIALKEAAETEYWIDLLEETEYVKVEQVADLKSELEEILKLLTSIIKTSKKNS